MTVRVFDHTACQLGEGPMWHPLLNQLFWFDIIGKTLFTQNAGKIQSWEFPEFVSAAGWIDRDNFLIASASALLRFDISCGESSPVTGLESNNPITRSNDGRADPWGGFWIGTMGINAEPDAGAIYRYFRGEMCQLFAPITIPNAICFSPDRRYGYFTDTTKAIIWRQPLNEADGWPVGDPEIFIDFSGTGINPDGAVIDAAGYFWNAQWGAARLARYSPDGVFEQEFSLPTDHITCPAFGGDVLTTLFVTSARQGLTASQISAQPDAGKTFVINVGTSGQKEHQVVI